MYMYIHISFCVCLANQILTRDFKPPKPDPAPVLHITQQWGFDCTNVMVVGDHRQDMECGRKAGAGNIALGVDER